MRWLSLVLVAILLASGAPNTLAGVLETHEEGRRALQGDHDDGNGRSSTPHMVRFRHGPTHSPCDACYFHKLLSCALLPARGTLWISDAPGRPGSKSPPKFQRLDSCTELSRGPPPLL